MTNFTSFIFDFQLNNCGEFRAVRDISVKPIKPAELNNLQSNGDTKKKPEKSAFATTMTVLKATRKFRQKGVERRIRRQSELSETSTTIPIEAFAY